MTLVCLFIYLFIYYSLYYLLIDHFTVFRLVSWPLNGSKAGGDLVLRQSFTSFVVLIYVVLILTSWNLNSKSREICIKVRLPQASPHGQCSISRRKQENVIHTAKMATPLLHVVPACIGAQLLCIK